ncbi:phosphotransferase [Rhizobium leguminosarum]|uniref:phosphotransferase enzyme family protein n=1 Tax=Rhizobium TaxID=379 RepID=UPI001C958C7A|nr:phosphotransferase [Rhizobium leguminosarum]MBY5780732.1 phosphotransferase [Rhizobium leguminosarum]MBY5783835.1 phosphotransferase [Rhizobium leguminosarum]MBY5796388.1 phosphotransferase [Rhizobium leguminosarum]UFW79121.1 phosphotransferase [Rhizobium leguminosarum bv. viciae]
MLDFNPLYSTPQVAAIEQFIHQHYPLAGPVSCRMLQRGLNDVYLAVASNGERYVFRLSHRRARGPADVKTEMAFLAHLSQSGVPVAAAIPTREGSLFLQGDAPEGVRQAVLFQAIEGRKPDAADAGDARANGTTLALMHNAAETFQPDGSLYRLDLEHLLHRPLARIVDSGVVEDAEVRSDLEDIAARTAQAIEAFADLTCTYCHGDCHGSNARINDAGEAVFFDFDDGGPGYLAYDLSVFLWAQISFGRRSTEMWDAFVDAYRAVRPIRPDDFEAAHRFVIVRHIWLMGEYASRAQEWGSETVGWIARQANFLKTWETERCVDRLF